MISNNAASSTIRSGATLGTMLGVLMSPHLPIRAEVAVPPTPVFIAASTWHPYYFNQLGDFSSAFSRLSTEAQRNIDAEILSAYADLAASQKSLDPEFANVLVDNLWDLYAR